MRCYARRKEAHKYKALAASLIQQGWQLHKDGSRRASRHSIQDEELAFPGLKGPQDVVRHQSSGTRAGLPVEKATRKHGIASSAKSGGHVAAEGDAAAWVRE